MQRLSTAVILLALCGLCAAQTNEEKLIAHADEFRPEVIKVTDGVWVAVGYALANSILIEGTDGVIIVDTTESKTAAKAIRVEFDKLTKKPVKAIIYTHNHYDHINGGEVFASGGHPDIYAQELLEKFVGNYHDCSTCAGKLTFRAPLVKLHICPNPTLSHPTPKKAAPQPFWAV